MAVSLKENNWFFVTDQTFKNNYFNFVAELSASLQVVFVAANVAIDSGCFQASKQKQAFEVNRLFLTVC
jgi:hypothetical protein